MKPRERLYILYAEFGPVHNTTWRIHAETLEQAWQEARLTIRLGELNEVTLVRGIDADHMQAIAP